MLNIDTHDDVIKWKHFPRYWPFVRGIHRSPVNSPHKGQWRGALMFSFICVWINGWVNNRKAGDLRRYRAHYDVTVMFSDNFSFQWQPELNHYGARTPIVLVGTKADLKDETPEAQKTTTEQGKELAKTIGAFSYLECSAKTAVRLPTVIFSWKRGVVRMPTLSSLVTPAVAVMTTAGVTRDDRVGITTIRFSVTESCFICERQPQIGRFAQKPCNGHPSQTTGN